MINAVKNYINRDLSLNEFYVSLHTKGAIESIEDIENDAFQMFENNFWRYEIGSYMKSTMDEVITSHLCIPNDQNICIKLLKYWSVFAKAYYTIAYNPGKEVSVVFREKPVMVVAKDLTTYTNMFDWTKALSAFLLVRDRQGINLMLSATDDDFMRSDLKPFGLHFKLLQMFRCIYSTEKDVDRFFEEAMEATSPNSGMYPIVPSPKFALYLWEPLIRVYYAIVRRNSQDFNAHLYDALSLHKEYYSGEKKSDTDGWISWWLLGAASLAFDLGMDVQVQSDYIPRFMVEGKL